jgi:hypothetical protein
MEESEIAFLQRRGKVGVVPVAGDETEIAACNTFPAGYAILRNAMPATDDSSGWSMPSVMPSSKRPGAA